MICLFPNSFRLFGALGLAVATAWTALPPTSIFGAVSAGSPLGVIVDKNGDWSWEGMALGGGTVGTEEGGGYIAEFV
jgi:hypothetical protein